MVPRVQALLPAAVTTVPGRGRRPTSAEIAAFQASLLAWYDENARQLPWRETRDPYRILVSEVMLQQTQVDRVLGYYRDFLLALPDEPSLAAAPTSKVISLWAGLGYNRRAVNLQRAVTAVVQDLAGSWPMVPEELQLLPGIGPYTAGAISCFAFEQDVVFLDTNMRRVLHRYFLGPEIPQPLASEREILRIAGLVLPIGDAWRWNQALIEFGALQCTARKPACVVCPLRSGCKAAPSIHSAIAVAGRKKPGEAIPFTSTNRYWRGRIIDALRDDADHRLDAQKLGALIRPEFHAGDLPWLRNLAEALSKDGLLVITESRARASGGWIASLPE